MKDEHLEQVGARQLEKERRKLERDMSNSLTTPIVLCLGKIESFMHLLTPRAVKDN